MLCVFFKLFLLLKVQLSQCGHGIKVVKILIIFHTELTIKLNANLSYFTRISRPKPYGYAEPLGPFAAWQLVLQPNAVLGKKEATPYSLLYIHCHTVLLKEYRQQVYVLFVYILMWWYPTYFRRNWIYNHATATTQDVAIYLLCQSNRMSISIMLWWLVFNG